MGFELLSQKNIDDILNGKTNDTKNPGDDDYPDDSEDCINDIVLPKAKFYKTNWEIISDCITLAEQLKNKDNRKNIFDYIIDRISINRKQHRKLPTFPKLIKKMGLDNLAKFVLFTAIGRSLSAKKSILNSDNPNLAFYMEFAECHKEKLGEVSIRTLQEFIKTDFPLVKEGIFLRCQSSELNPYFHSFELNKGFINFLDEKAFQIFEIYPSISVIKNSQLDDNNLNSNEVKNISKINTQAFKIKLNKSKGRYILHGKNSDYKILRNQALEICKKSKMDVIECNLANADCKRELLEILSYICRKKNMILLSNYLEEDIHDDDIFSNPIKDVSLLYNTHNSIDAQTIIITDTKITDDTHKYFDRIYNYSNEKWSILNRPKLINECDDNPILTENTKQSCMKNIIVNPELNKNILQILNWRELRRNIKKNFGISENSSFIPRGLKILFHGIPGTGKTHAADIIMKNTGDRFIKVNSPEIISKWVGDSEKNLDNLFKEAIDENGSLFFDEADALFGRRSNISNSTDAHRNSFINLLLQKTEEFPGLIILTTNHIDLIDTAFIRRMNKIIEFTIPGSTERFKLWKLILPKKIGETNIKRIKHLADNYIVTGSQIRECVYNTMQAAAVNGYDIKRFYDSLENECSLIAKKEKRVCTVGFV